MQDNLKFIINQLDRSHSEVVTARRQAEAERQKANIYVTEGRLGDSDNHNQQAQQYDQKADELEAQISALEPKKVELESKVTQLKTEREKINRETLEKTIAIDKELARLTGGL